MADSQSRATTVQWNIVDDMGPLANATRREAITIDQQLIDDFQRDGVCYVPGAFVEWVEPLRAGLGRVMSAPDDYAFTSDSAEPGEPGRFFDTYCNWQRVPEFSTFALTSTAASLAAQCMQSSTAQFFHEHAFAKESGTQKATPWHHDLPYYCIDGHQTASVYVALDDTPAETAVRFLAGSHRDGNTYVPRRFRTGSDYDYDDPTMVSAPTFEGDDDDARVIARELSAGDAIVFDFRTLHGTTDAPVTTRRRAFSTRWLGDDVRYIERLGVTSPPLDLDLAPGDRMPETLFPTLWSTS